MAKWEWYDLFARLIAHVSWVGSDLQDLDHVAEGRSRMICARYALAHVSLVKSVLCNSRIQIVLNMLLPSALVCGDGQVHGWGWATP